jgi:hypothetical protein
MKALIFVDLVFDLKVQAVIVAQQTDALFQRFDLLTEQVGVQKIESKGS